MSAKSLPCNFFFRKWLTSSSSVGWNLKPTGSAAADDMAMSGFHQENKCEETQESKCYSVHLSSVPQSLVVDQNWRAWSGFEDEHLKIVRNWLGFGPQSLALCLLWIFALSVDWWVPRTTASFSVLVCSRVLSQKLNLRGRKRCIGFMDCADQSFLKLSFEKEKLPSSILFYYVCVISPFFSQHIPSHFKLKRRVWNSPLIISISHTWVQIVYMQSIKFFWNFVRVIF